MLLYPNSFKEGVCASEKAEELEFSAGGGTDEWWCVCSWVSFQKLCRTVNTRTCQIGIPQTYSWKFWKTDHKSSGQRVCQDGDGKSKTMLVQYNCHHCYHSHHWPTVHSKLTTVTTFRCHHWPLTTAAPHLLPVTMSSTLTIVTCNFLTTTVSAPFRCNQFVVCCDSVKENRDVTMQGRRSCALNCNFENEIELICNLINAPQLPRFCEATLRMLRITANEQHHSVFATTFDRFPNQNEKKRCLVVVCLFVQRRSN